MVAVAIIIIIQFFNNNSNNINNNNLPSGDVKRFWMQVEIFNLLDNRYHACAEFLIVNTFLKMFCQDEV